MKQGGVILALAGVTLSIVGVASAAAGAGRPAAAPLAGNGAQLFKQRCGMCHVPPAGQKPVLGPTLDGVVGRKAGSTAFNYSPYVKGSSIVWTRQNLDRFLTAPQQMIRGSKMLVAVPNPQDRAAIIDYLATTGK